MIKKLIENFTNAGPDRQLLLSELEAANLYLNYGFQADNNQVCIVLNISVVLVCE